MRINSANNISQIPIIPVVNFTQNEKHPEFFDITFPEIELFQEYSSLEIDIEVYPLTIDLNTKQYSIDPYEAYNKDDKIRYKKMYDTYALAFALFVGINTTGILGYAHADDLPQYISFEEIAACLGISYGSYNYFRPHVEELLQKRTKNQKYVFKEQYYTHELHNDDTFVLEKEFARAQVIGSNRLLPKYMLYDQNNHSSLLRMKFLQEQFCDKTGTLNIGTIHIDKDRIEEISKVGLQLGVHIKLGKDEKRGTTKEELRQILHNGVPGIITPEKELLENQFTYSLTKTYLGNRRKKYIDKDTLQGVLLNLTSKKPAE